MKLRFCLKKEWAHFSRTFKIWGVIIAAFAVVIAYPLMYKFTGIVMGELVNRGLSISIGEVDAGFLDGMGFEEMAAMFSDASLMYTVAVSGMISIVMLVFMLVLCSAAGGEQKKRAMIIPLCSGLSTKHYVLAKFILYPLVCFIDVFLSSMLCGALCNALFSNNFINIGNLVISSVMTGVYVVFVICVFMSLGLCTSKPGVMTAIIYIAITIAQTVLQMISNNYGQILYNPFVLVQTVTGGSVSADFPLADYSLNIIVSIIVTIAVSALMPLLAIAVLNAKKINNRAEKKPEF